MECQKKGCTEELSSGEKLLSISRSCFHLCEIHEKEMLKVQEDYIDSTPDKGEDCNCGYKVEEGCNGCGAVIEEWTKEDDEGKIIDNGWYHCGENNMLCDECKDELSVEEQSKRELHKDYDT